MPKTSLDRRATSAKSVVEQTTTFTGKTFAGKYRIKSIIGSDFMGTLYKAEDIVAGQELAIKILCRGFFLSSDVVKRIDHPNISKLIRVLKHKDGTTAVITEVPPGTSVKTLLSKGQKITPGEAVSAALQMLSAIHAVHSKRIVVQNLSSESVYFDKDASGDLAIKMSNIGLCDRRKLPDNPSFLSPEVILGGADPDKRSDIWSVGVVLFEMLFGRRPFSGKNQDELVGNILLRDPVFPELSGDAPKEVISILEKALEKEPENRFQNVTTMIGDLLPLQEALEESLSEEIEEALRKSLAPPPRAVPGKGLKTKTQVIGKMTLGVSGPKLPVPGAKPVKRPTMGMKPGKLPVPGAKPVKRPTMGMKPGKLPVPGAKPEKQSAAGVKSGRGPAPGAKTIGRLSPLKPLKPPAKPKEETPRSKGTMEFSKDMINPAIASGGQAQAQRVDTSKKVRAKTQVLTSLDTPAREENAPKKAPAHPLPHIVDTRPKVKDNAVAGAVATTDKPDDGTAESAGKPATEGHVQVVSTDQRGDLASGDLVTMDITFEDDRDATTSPSLSVDSDESAIDMEVASPLKAGMSIGAQWLSKGRKLAVVIGVAVIAYLPKVKGLAVKVLEWLTGPQNPFSAMVRRVTGFGSKAGKPAALAGATPVASVPRVRSWSAASKMWIKTVTGTVVAWISKGISWISENRKLGAIIGGVVALLFLVVLVVSLSTGSETPSPGVKQASVLRETRAPSKPDVKPSSDVVPTVSPEPDNVLVELQGLPSGARVMVDDRNVSLPITLPLSDDPVTVSVHAEGYKTFSDTVVPDRNLKVPVAMEKDDSARKTSGVRSERSATKKTASKSRTGKRKRKGKRSSAKKKTSKQTVNRGKLASNPFGD